ncbi:MAG: ATP-dependent DNA helicase RecG [Ruminococcaceae bacterium]|nr:ATP-dependent DNA helicase RecG [Oscillospiraceae bacterium]
MNNKSDLLTVKGIGKTKVSTLSKLGIDSVDALLRYYPRDYKDYTHITPISEVMPEVLVNIKGIIKGEVKTENLYRQPISRSTFKVSDNSGSITVVLFHKRQIPFYLKTNTQYIFSGKASGNLFDLVMSSPAVVFENESRLQPVYALKGGMTSKQISSAVKSALSSHTPTDILPEHIRKKYGLCEYEFAISNIHFPISVSAKEAAKKRLVFEELFILFTAFSILKSKNKEATGIIVKKDFTDEFLKFLPFEPTSAQKRVIKECSSDIMSGKPMSRLVQGDVGCGKTAVAAALCYSLVKNGYQAAIMAPTEILAKQHFETFSKFFKGTAIKCRLFTGSLTAKQKAQNFADLKNGKIDVSIGTHALISDNVEFNNLGLVITDEQHRFGVTQRAKLSAKGNIPHRLVMSATPIPRTLALIIYGELDVSIIDEYPKNRLAVESYSVSPSLRQRVYSFLKKHIDEGRQSYIVCPLVEENDSDLVSAEEYFKKIKENEFKDYKVGLLHGKMKSNEKEAVMSSFANGDIDILVCTTVVEVGVDVPNAAVMVIENAERFGMSQLHQLRGRIGRGSYKSTCIFISKSKNNERLQIMCKTQDGFKIANEDLKMRGPGEFMGKRQHGLPELKIADLSSDMELVKLAVNSAKEIIKESPDLNEYPLLKSAVIDVLKNSDN